MMGPRATKSDALNLPPSGAPPESGGAVGSKGAAASAPEEVELGYVAGVFGFRGDLRLHLHNHESSTLRKAAPVTLVDPSGVRVPGRLASRPGAGKRILGRLEGVDSEEAARALVGWRIVVPAKALPKPGRDEYYVRDLEGLEVWVAERRYGTLTRVHGTGVTDVLEIAVPGLRDPVFIPFLKALVVAVDVPGRRVELAPEAVADADVDDRPAPDRSDDAGDEGDEGDGGADADAGDEADET